MDEEYGIETEKRRLNAFWIGNYKEGKPLEAAILKRQEIHGADNVIVSTAYEVLDTKELKGYKGIYIKNEALNNA